MQENVAKTAAEWVFVARSVAQLPDGQAQALRCMARAGVLAQGDEEWIAIAEAWARDFDDTGMARHCMAKAENNAVHSYDWIELAKIWKENIQDSDEAQRYLAEAENAAEDTGDWVLIAKIWKKNFQDTDNAIRCMEQAEEVADYFEDYSALEETWREDFHDVGRDIVRSAIQRLVDAAGAEFGLAEIMDSAFGSQGSNQVSLVSETEVAKADEAPMGITDLGYLMLGAGFTQTGIWNSECYSAHRPDCYARRYAFKVTMPLVVRIDLSSEVDAYLYLLDADGNVLEENDDWQDGTDSRISRHLAAGTYTIEATTFGEEESGEFSLVINT